MTGRFIKISALMIALVLVVAVSAWAGGSKDLGKELTFGNFWMNYDTKTYEPTTENDELVLEWRKKVEKDVGFTIREKMVADWGQMLQTITTSVMAGRPAAQLFHVEPGWAMSLMRQKLLAPISDSKVVDFKTTRAIAYRQPIYNQDIHKLFTFDNKFYATCYGYGGSRHSLGIYFNKRLFKEAGLDPDHLYNLQKSNTFTWDAFLEICHKLTRDTDNDGIPDAYAICGQFDDGILEALIFGNGAMYVGQDASGKFFNATVRPEFLEAMHFARRLMDLGIMMPRPEGSNWDWAFSAFHTGRIAMYFQPEWQCGNFISMSDDWGYVLPPRGPKASITTFPNDENIIVVPSVYKGEDLDAIVRAMHHWYMPVDEDWKTGLWASYKDRRAVEETHALIRNPRHSVFRMHMMVPTLQTGDIAWQLWWIDSDPSQLIESVSLSWNSLISEANVK